MVNRGHPVNIKPQSALALILLRLFLNGTFMPAVFTLKRPGIKVPQVTSLPPPSYLHEFQAYSCRHLCDAYLDQRARVVINPECGHSVGALVGHQ